MSHATTGHLVMLAVSRRKHMGACALCLVIGRPCLVLGRLERRMKKVLGVLYNTDPTVEAHVKKELAKRMAREGSPADPLDHLTDEEEQILQNLLDRSVRRV